MGAGRKLAMEIRRNKYAIVHAWGSGAIRLTRWAMLAGGRAARSAKWLCQANETMSHPESPVFPVRSPDWIVGDPWLLRSISTGSKTKSIPLAAPAPALVKSESKLPTNKERGDVVRIGTVCPLEVRYGLKHLIWSLDQLKCVRSDLRLVVWGRGAQSHDLRRYVRLIGISDWIKWRSPKRDIRSELSELDLYWHAPRSEGLAPALVAALTFGLPSIAPRTAATLELAKTWPNQLVIVPWGARDEIARQTQQWLERGFAQDATSVTADWLRAHHPVQVASEYAAAYREALAE